MVFNYSCGSIWGTEEGKRPDKAILYPESMSIPRSFKDNVIRPPIIHLLWIWTRTSLDNIPVWNQPRYYCFKKILLQLKYIEENKAEVCIDWSNWSISHNNNKLCWLLGKIGSSGRWWIQPCFNFPCNRWLIWPHNKV